MYTWKDVGENTNGKPLSQAERQAIADQWNAWDADKPMRDWKRAMGRSDRTMDARLVEELADLAANGIPLSQNSIDKLTARKALRASKP